MANYSVVPCAEEHATQRENVSLDGGAQCTVVLRCDWEDRHALVSDIIGFMREWPNGNFADPPLAHAASVLPAPTTGEQAGQDIEYQHALVTVQYSSDKGRDLVSESLEPTTEFLRQDWKNFYWTTGANRVAITQDEAPGLLFKGLSLVRTLFRVEPPLPVSLLELPGSVNDTDYFSQLLDLTFPQETLLYNPPNLSRTINAAGSRAYNLNLKFNFKPQGWNKYWRAGGTPPGWYRMYLKNGNPFDAYPPDDFSDFLF